MSTSNWRKEKGLALVHSGREKRGERSGESGSLVWRTPSFACGLPPPKFKHETCAHHLGESAITIISIHDGF